MAQFSVVQIDLVQLPTLFQDLPQDVAYSCPAPFPAKPSWKKLTVNKPHAKEVSAHRQQVWSHMDRICSFEQFCLSLHSGTVRVYPPNLQSHPISIPVSQYNYANAAFAQDAQIENLLFADKFHCLDP
jgi:hypothetical protein